MIDQHAARSVIDVITGTWRAQALYAAAALRIPDYVAEGCTTCEQLARKTPVSLDGMRRLMRLLVAMGVFDSVDHAGYRLNSVSELLRSDVSGSMRDLCLIYGEEFHQAWGAIVPALRAGTTGFAEAFGSSLGEYLSETPGAGPKFQRAMSVGSAFFAEVSRSLDLSGCGTVVDVGGGCGTLLSMVLEANPDVHGVLFELPHIAALGKEHLDRTVGADRYEIVTGDVLEKVPGGADAYLVSRVLQDWDDASCVTILSHCRKAMTPSAKLFVLERIISVEDATVLPIMWDLHLMMTVGGRERTRGEYDAIFSRAGLKIESVRKLPLETSLLVAVPE